ncbi:MAG: hypothetical protein ACK4SY_01700 [Pyrobaculum sp.]
MELLEHITRVFSVFLSTALGLLLARYLYDRLEALTRPLSRRLGVPAPLLALSIGEARAPHVVMAQWLRGGAVAFRHVLVFSFLTWPIRVVLLHLRLGIIPLALGALGLLGAIYLSVVYLPSVVGLLLALHLGRGLVWPVGIDAGRQFASINILKTAGGLTARYAAFEAIFAAMDLLGIRIDFSFLPLRPEALAVASVASVRPSLGIMAAAPAYFGGRISAGEVLLSLLLGRLVYMSVFEFPRSAVQFYGSIYPPSVASRLVLYTALVMYGATLPILAVLFITAGAGGLQTA